MSPRAVGSSISTSIRQRTFARIDIASLVFFRIAFGLLMIWMGVLVLKRGLIEPWYIKSQFLFNYVGFSWVQPWPGNGLYIHWIALCILAGFVAAGFFYRISITLFFLSYSYFFLLDQGRYVNHTYLICLFSFLLIFMPAHRAFSIDAWFWSAQTRPRFGSRRHVAALHNPADQNSPTAPAWSLWLLRLQIAVVYFFAGIAKITSDWLQGEPLRFWLERRAHFPIFDSFFHQEWAVHAASYGSLLLDLCLAPLLFWRRTRIYAFSAAVTFHLLNEWIFPLDIFPWLAIAATTLFLRPDWPRRILHWRDGLRPVYSEKAGRNESHASIEKQNLVLTLAIIYAAIQILVPLRNFLSRGGIEWTYMEHRFSWQMMLRIDAMATFFLITDPSTGQSEQLRPREYLSTKQMKRMGWRPDMVWQFAQFLAKTRPRAGEKPLEVRARMFVSINGRKPLNFLDHNVDLAAEPRPYTRPRWLLEIHDPLPPMAERISHQKSGPKSNDED